MLEKMMDMQILLYCMAALGAIGAVGMLATHLTYRRIMKSTNAAKGLKEKWLDLWKTRDRLLGRMNRFVWYPSLLSTALLGAAFAIVTKLDLKDGLPLTYLYLGAALPMVLLLLRQALDFTYREELVLESLVDYVDHARSYVKERDIRQTKDPVLREEVVDQIAQSIRQTAATGSHFSRMLSDEEEEILREVIREFMEE
jgi:type III secretory pathway component EscU